jgi:hypothetical protein
MTNNSPSETEQTFIIGQPLNALYRDRYAYDRQQILQDAVRAWRLNPIARRIANLYEYYVVDRITFKCDHKPTMDFLNQFWTHELNRMDFKLKQIAKEMYLTGNLFPLYSVDASGMTYFRIFPTDRINHIVTADNDLEQEISYVTYTNSVTMQEQTFVNPRGLPTIATPVFMKHHTINQLAGTVWGEGEIWPDLPWLSRYAQWMEDRVRLNHYRSAFMYVVSGKYASEAERAKREREINNNPPRSGSILVQNSDAGEQWAMLSPSLDSTDAATDGLALKKMIAVNHVPMHFLSEGEDSTRTTSDAAGSPTFKQFANQQAVFEDILHDILVTVVKRRAEKDDTIDATAKIMINAGDTTVRDNAALALATSQIVTAIGEMFDRQLIDAQEYLRLVYRFSGEVMPADLNVGAQGLRPLRKPLSTKPATVPADGSIQDNTATGNVQEKVKNPQ